MIKIFIKILIFTLFYSNYCLSAVVNKIEVKGNQRLASESIIVLSGIKLNTDVSKTEINNSLKELYKTDFFKDIQLFQNKNTLIITVVENPIIEKIEITGIKKQSSVATSAI